MINKKFLVFPVIFALLIAVLFSGCTDSSDSESGASSEVETQDYDSQSSSSSNADEASEILELIGNHDKVWSYSYEYTMNSKVSGQNIEISGSGIVDTKNKKTYMYLSSENGSIEYYYFQDAVYMGAVANGETQWMKMPASSEDFEDNFDVMAQYDESVYELENSDFILEGEETVNGILCYKVRMTVKDIYEDMVSEYAVEDGEVSEWETADVIYYIGKSNGYLVKTTANIKGTDKSGESFEINYVLSLKNINEVQNIELPKEAENAIDMSDYYSNYQ
ncbi:hypothetical protein [Methanococcus maripaludis]|uniref:Outer membrane lipoprotein-sorting protein n=1 Tax=Methanococcus maripaludis TaxID=39152 RepID=A0A7J9PPR4_METMI|nr:hypothetical protein [Methanococcus maripaludis]MBA2868096.1 hypothetical protein [Methanococcus maripaludis]